LYTNTNDVQPPSAVMCIAHNGRSIRDPAEAIDAQARAMPYRALPHLAVPSRQGHRRSERPVATAALPVERVPGGIVLSFDQ